MPDDYEISLSVEDLPSEEGHVLAPDFLRAVQLLLATLKRIEHQVTSGAEKDSIYFRVVGLSHSSLGCLTGCEIAFLGTRCLEQEVQLGFLAGPSTHER